MVMLILTSQQFLVVAVAVAVAMIAMTNVASAETTTGSESVTCEMELTDYTFSDEEGFSSALATEDEWNCVDESDNLYKLEGDWERMFTDFDVQSGLTVFDFQDVTVTQPPDSFHGIPIITVHETSKICEREGQRDCEGERECECKCKCECKREGEHQKEAFVRVTDSAGMQPRLDAAAISDRIFATLGGVESIKTQIESCSGDRLKLYKTTRNSDIVGGVLELTLEVAVADYSHEQRKDLERVVNGMIADAGYNVRSFGLVMYIMPETTNLGANNVLGYAYVGGVKSVYRGVPSFQTTVHEVGHNIGLGHSGIEDGLDSFYTEYGDT
eukprot:jgi/Psemu1/22252/gm1.22252_g